MLLYTMNTFYDFKYISMIPIDVTNKVDINYS